MPWRALPDIAFAIAIYPFTPQESADLPLQLGDELYIIEEGGPAGAWYRGYLVAPPSLLAGLTTAEGQTLEARVFSGVFPSNCVEIREVLGDIAANQVDGQYGQLSPLAPTRLLPPIETGPNVFELHGSVPVSPVQDAGQSQVYELYGDIDRQSKDVIMPSKPERAQNGLPPKMNLMKRLSVRRTPSYNSQKRESLANGAFDESIEPNPTQTPAKETHDAKLTAGANAPFLTQKPMAPVPMLRIGGEPSTAHKEPLVDEISSCMREWHSSSIHELLLRRDYTRLMQLNHSTVELDIVRKQLSHALLTEQEALSVRTRAVWLLVQGNKLLGREVLVRDPQLRGRLLGAQDSAIDVVKLQSSMSLLETQPSEDWDEGLLDYRDLSNQLSDSRSGSVSSTQPTAVSGDSSRPDNETLRGILKWRDKTPPELKDLLHRFPYIPEPQLARVYGDTLDALFCILVERSGHSEYEDLVFDALITTLTLIHDRRFSLSPVVDEYISNRFHHPFATPVLVRTLTKLLAEPASAEYSRKLRAALKVGSKVFRFIMRARLQQKAKEASIGITSLQPSFDRDLRNLFRSLDTLMQSQDPRLIGTQTLAVQHYYSWAAELPALLSTAEIYEVVTDYVNSCVDVKGKLVLFRLALIAKINASSMFEEPEYRKQLSLRTLDWISPYLTLPPSSVVTQLWKEQLRLCLSALSSQVESQETAGLVWSSFLPRLLEIYLFLQDQPKEQDRKSSFSLLFPRAYPLPIKRCSPTAYFDEALVEISALLAGLSKIEGLPSRSLFFDDPNFIMRLIKVFQSMLRFESIPASWLSVNIHQHVAVLRFLELMLDPLISKHVPEPDHAETFNTGLWQDYLQTLFSVAGSEYLALETFADQKRRAVWVIGGDVRAHGAALLRASWQALGWDTSPADQRLYGFDRMGGYQVQYVPSQVGEVVELCLSPHEGLRTAAVEMMQTMLISEWALDQDLSMIQAEITTKLNQLFRAKSKADDAYHKVFITELLDRFEASAEIPGDVFYAAVRTLALVVDELLDLLIAVHAIELGGEARQGVHTLRLMEFLKGMQKEDIFIHYVHQLSQNLARQGQAAEAGLSLQLHAELYEWDTSIMAEQLSDPFFPEQSHFARKEIIYLEMIRLFEDGKSWENEMVAYRELAQQYEANTFDLFKLAKTQKAMAKIFENIARGNRHLPRYVRVVYSGLGFPIGLRGKAFILQTPPQEKLVTSIEKLQELHPAARISTLADQTEAEGQFLEVSAVVPFHDYQHPVYQKPMVAIGTRTYLSWPRRNVFAAATKRMHIVKLASQTPPTNTLDQTVYVTNESFPNILQKSEVVEMTTVQLPLVHPAIERTIRKTQELVTLHKRVADGRAEFLSSLTTFLLSSVDLSVDNSVAAYRSLLPSEVLDANNLVPDDDSGHQVEVNGARQARAAPDRLQLALKISLMDHAAECQRAFSVYRGKEQAKELLQDLQEKWELSYAPDLASLPDDSKPAAPVVIPLRAASRSLASSGHTLITDLKPPAE